MKIIVLLLVILCTAACSPNEVEYAQARFACKDKGGLYEVYYDVWAAAHCNNGERVTKIGGLVITDPEYFNQQGRAE